jgi:hypothetical protein
MSSENAIRHSGFKGFKQLDGSWKLTSEQGGSLNVKNLEGAQLAIKNYNSGEVYAEFNEAGVITKKS